ncbi:transmembrane protein 190 isoform X1 [Phascolarctos cinereus]|uniref:Transmembrane protein 190 isoform X2 n=1 Tax=Phascolarctos cinereus TaxID=38626 RepID=A0A6P5LTT6_PHACI|nr:transmembrane protein 190 isoform X2 [Phascolarctos cinereus]
MVATAILAFGFLLLVMCRADANGIQGFFSPWSCEGDMWERQACGGQAAVENPNLCFRLHCCYEEGNCFHKTLDESLRKKHLWTLGLTCAGLVMFIFFICFFWWARRRGLHKSLKMPGRLSDSGKPKTSRKSSMSSHSFSFKKKEQSPLLADGGGPKQLGDDAAEAMEGTEEEEEEGEEEDEY